MTEITSFKKCLEDEQMVEEIGSELLRKAIRAATEEKLGLARSETSVERTVRQGDRVPTDLHDRVEVDSDGAAIAGWRDSWTDFGIWTDHWSDASGGMGQPYEDRPTLEEIPGLDSHRRLGYEAMLTDEEIEVLDDLDLLDT